MAMPETTPPMPIESHTGSSGDAESQSGNPPSSKPEKIPRHIAIIMDGNGRWANQRGKPRTDGHSTGAEVAQDIAMEASRLGVEALTLYSFSTENWKRPREEIDFLMKLGESYLRAQQDRISESNIRFRHIGSRNGLSDEVLAGFDEVAQSTANNTGMTLGLAINYGSRIEITEAVQNIAEQVKRGELSPDQITEQTISDNLYTASMPEPDLLIRTAGEMRLSNFLLWQISYAELWVTPTFWPAFSITEFHEAIADYNRRQRRFGAV